MLFYIHYVFARNPVNCLMDIKVCGPRSVSVSFSYDPEVHLWKREREKGKGKGQRKLKATEFASVQDLWPRDGVLRVEIIKNVSDRYNITESYRKEYGDNMVLELLQVRIVLSPGAMLLIIREPWLPVSQT